MLISDDFVYIHHPKTGGTFVTEMLLGMQRRVPWFRCEVVPRQKHAGAARIPSGDQGKLILVNVRNVFDHYVSRYSFRWWAEPKHAKNRFDMDAIRRDFPTFPALSFSEFLTLYNVWAYRRPTKRAGRNATLDSYEIGHNTHTLLRMTQTGVMDLIRCFDDMPDSELASRFANVRFLRTETLNADLACFLEEIGLPAAEIEFVRNSAPILPSGHRRGPQTHWRAYFTDKDIRFVQHRDRLYFRMFPDMRPAQHGSTGRAVAGP